ncbi:MAG: hypothetical protein M3O50_07180 [Myxococcota bacterium]|nr:hypothetical protein [Myxococcota bacterium]
MRIDQFDMASERFDGAFARVEGKAGAPAGGPGFVGHGYRAEDLGAPGAGDRGSGVGDRNLHVARQAGAYRHPSVRRRMAEAVVQYVLDDALEERTIGVDANAGPFERLLQQLVCPGFETSPIWARCALTPARDRRMPGFRLTAA